MMSKYFVSENLIGYGVYDCEAMGEYKLMFICSNFSNAEKIVKIMNDDYQSFFTLNNEE